MGQKVNPHGLRVGVIKNWDSRWFAKDAVFGDTLVEDYNLRKFLKNKLYGAGVPKVEIERTGDNKVRIHIHCAKPGMVIGRQGSEIEKLRLECEQMLNKGKEEKVQVFLNIVEVKQPDKDAQLVAENIAAQLERRIPYRKAMKGAMGRTMRLGAKGIKAMCSGRLGGAEIARSETYHEGKDGYLIFIPENLTALKNGGRISPAVAAVGNVIGLKPVITLTEGVSSSGSFQVFYATDIQKKCNFLHRKRVTKV